MRTTKVKSEWAIPFRNKNFTLFFIGQMISAFGDWCSYVIIPLLIYHMTNDASTVGILMIFRVLPNILLSPFIGRVIAKFTLLRVMVVADLVRGLGYLAFLLVKTPLEIYLLTVVLAAGSAFFNPGRFALIPPLVPKETLARANSYMDGTIQLAMLVGPALGGVVFGVFGDKVGLIFNAMSFFVSMISLMLVRLPKMEKQKVAQVSEEKSEELGKRESGLARFAKTFRALRSRKLLFVVVMIGTLPNLGFGGNLTALFPVLANDVFHSPQWMYGAIMSLLGGGIFMGTMLSPILQKKMARFPLLCISTMIGAVFVVLFGSSNNPFLALSMIFLVGLNNGIGENAETTFLQLETEKRGDAPDVFSLQQALLSTTFIVGTVLASGLAPKIGPQHAVMWLALVPFLAGVTMLMIYFLDQKESQRSWRKTY